MSTADLYADLIRRAEACGVEAVACDAGGSIADSRFAEGKAAAYRHAAELLRGAVAAAVEEEREANLAACSEVVGRWADRADTGGHGDFDGDECEMVASGAADARDAIRARGESPRGDAASDGREGAE